MEKEREQSCLLDPKRKREISKAGDYFLSWLDLDHWNSKHRKKPLGHISTTRIIGTRTSNFFFSILDLGMKFYPFFVG